MGVIGGGMIVAAGTRMTWVTATARGASVSAPGLPTVPFGGGLFAFDAGDLGSGYLFGLGLLLALVPLGWLVAGPRGRVALGVLGLALSIGIGVAVASTRGDLIPAARRIVLRDTGPGASMRIATGPGAAVTSAGAALAGLSSILGAAAGARLPKMRMPERPDRDDR